MITLTSDNIKQLSLYFFTYHGKESLVTCIPKNLNILITHIFEAI